MIDFVVLFVHLLIGYLLGIYFSRKKGTESDLTSGDLQEPHSNDV